MKKFFLIFVISFNLFAAKKKERIVFDLCRGECYRVIQENEITAKYVKVKCTEKELRQMQPWNYK